MKKLLQPWAASGWGQSMLWPSEADEAEFIWISEAYGSMLSALLDLYSPLHVSFKVSLSISLTLHLALCSYDKAYLLL